MSALISSTLLTATDFFLAQQPGNNTGGEGPDFGKSSPLGLLVLILFFVAVVFLVRSMTKHLKRVPTSFDSKESKDKKPPVDGT